MTLGAARRAPIIGVLGLLGAAYASILVIDDPPLDTRAVIVGAALLGVGELAHLSIEARSSVADEGRTARGVGSVALLALGALLAGGGLIAAADVVRTGGLAIEIVGAAAALGAVGLLVAVAHAARDT